LTLPLRTPAMPDDPVHQAIGLHLADAQRERAYSPSSCIGGDYRPFVDAYRTRSAAAREQARSLGANWQRVKCRGHALPALELFLPPATARPSAGCPVLVFIHGGYWQELSAADSLFAAAQCVQRGIAFAAVDYTLAPAATVAGIVAECRDALDWLHAHAAGLSIDAGRIVVAGSSAGAHLAAMVALRPAAGAPRPRFEPRAVVLVSGIYWLEPLVGTSINDALHLDAAEARAESPALHALAGFPRALVCWGEVETDAFKAQGRGFAAALRRAGAACEDFEVPRRNHFDVIVDLADPATLLGGRVQALFDAA
jgi:arylformamidase